MRWKSVIVVNACVCERRMMSDSTDGVVVTWQLLSGCFNVWVLEIRGKYPVSVKCAGVWFTLDYD